MLGQKYCLDRNRVFATGFSGGARMASQLACDASNVFAAVAPVSGLRFPSPCQSSRPVPVVAFHGTADPVDPYLGNGQAYWTYSVPVAASRWANHNGCATSPSRSQPDDGVALTAYGKLRGRFGGGPLLDYRGGPRVAGGPAPAQVDHLPISDRRALRSVPMRPCGPSSSPIPLPECASGSRPSPRCPSGRRPGNRGIESLSVVHLSGIQWVIVLGLSIVWAVLGYVLSENDRKRLGRTPWGLPSAVWAFLWFLSLVVGLVLYLIAHAVGIRRAQQGSTVAGSPVAAAPPPLAQGSGTRRRPDRGRAFPSYPQPANARAGPDRVVTGRRRRAQPLRRDLSRR